MPERQECTTLTILLEHAFAARADIGVMNEDLYYTYYRTVVVSQHWSPPN